MKKKRSALGLSLLIIAITSFHPPTTSKHFTIKQLAPGVWAAINNDNYGHAICNAGIVDLGDKTLIFDPFMNIDAAMDLKQVARQLTHRDASIIINSHYHNDHIRGNQVFVPAEFISTSWTRAKMAVSEPEDLAWEKENAPKFAKLTREKLLTAKGKEKEELPMWIGYYDAMVTNNPLIKTTLPTLTFSDSLWIHGPGKRVLLAEYKNGHSGSDVVMILPKEGIAFMGDLLFEKRHPYLADGVPESWVKTLEVFYSDTSLHQFIPGHGDVGGKTVVKEMSRYITDVQQLVDNAILKQQPDSVIKKTAVPAQYADWKFDRFFGFNLSFLIKQHHASEKK